MNNWWSHAVGHVIKSTNRVSARLLCTRSKCTGYIYSANFVYCAHLSLDHWESHTAKPVWWNRPIKVLNGNYYAAPLVLLRDDCARCERCRLAWGLVRLYIYCILLNGRILAVVSSGVPDPVTIPYIATRRHQEARKPSQECKLD